MSTKEMWNKKDLFSAFVRSTLYTQICIGVKNRKLRECYYIYCWNISVNRRYYSFVTLLFDSFKYTSRWYVTRGNIYRGADKSLARPGRKKATATEDFEFYIIIIIIIIIQQSLLRQIQSLFQSELST
jgi:hypothetical protein